MISPTETTISAMMKAHPQVGIVSAAYSAKSRNASMGGSIPPNGCNRINKYVLAGVIYITLAGLAEARTCIQWQVTGAYAFVPCQGRAARLSKPFRTHFRRVLDRTARP